MARVGKEHRIHPQTTKRSVTTTTIKLTREDIVAAVRTAFCLVDLPDDAKVSFVSPRGGDWSGMTIDVDEDNPVSVTYRTTTTDEPSNTPAERANLEQARVSNPDNDDAKLDIIAKTLGLDSDTATHEQIMVGVNQLCARIEWRLKREQR